MSEMRPDTAQKCRFGGILMTVFTVIVGIITIFAYLNDICVFPPSQECAQDQNQELRRPCWEDNIVYIKTSDESLVVSQRSGLPTVQDCMESCLRHKEQGCLYWTYNKVDKRCYLKNERASEGRVNEAFVSGTLDCASPPLSEDEHETSEPVFCAPGSADCAMPPLSQINTDIIRSPTNRDKINFPASS